MRGNRGSMVWTTETNNGGLAKFEVDFSVSETIRGDWFNPPEYGNVSILTFELVDYYDPGDESIGAREVRFNTMTDSEKEAITRVYQTLLDASESVWSSLAENALDNLERVC